MNIRTAVLALLLAFNGTANACQPILAELNGKIELYEQLLGAFRQTNQTLEEVYSTFGRRLTETKDSKEIAKISEHFLKSAEHLRMNKASSDQALEQLLRETQEIRQRLVSCLEASAKPFGKVP